MQNSKWGFLVICLVAIIIVNKSSPVPDSKNQIKSLRDTSLEFEDLDLASSDEAGVSIKESPKSNPTRGKRTVGFLRTLFPNLSQIIDRKIQQITRVLFRVIGRLVLRGGNGGGGDDDKEGRKISITLPTYPPSEEDEEEDETESPEDSNTESTSDGEATTTPDSFSGIPSLENADNTIAESQAITKIARKARDVTSAEKKKEASKRESNDVEQQENKSIEDDKPSNKEEEGKSKRVLFKFGGSGGASGNLLFDLIRILNV